MLLCRWVKFCSELWFSSLFCLVVICWIIYSVKIRVQSHLLFREGLSGSVHICPARNPQVWQLTGQSDYFTCLKLVFKGLTNNHQFGNLLLFEHEVCFWKNEQTVKLLLLNELCLFRLVLFFVSFHKRNRIVIWKNLEILSIFIGFCCKPIWNFWRRLEIKIHSWKFSSFSNKWISVLFCTNETKCHKKSKKIILSNLTVFSRQVFL